MFRLNEALAHWRERIAWRQGVTAADIEEMETHLRDEIEALTSRGLSEHEAFFIGVRGFGHEEELSRRFRWANWEHVVRMWFFSTPALLLSSLKVAGRGLLRHRVYSLISLSSLAIGLACLAMAALFIHHELGSEDSHERHDRIFRLIRGVRSSDGPLHYHGGRTAGGISPELEGAFRDIEEVVRVSLSDTRITGDPRGSTRRLAITDANVLNVFTLSLLQGDLAAALADPASIVLTRSLSDDLFGARDPIGLPLELEGPYAGGHYTVGAIVEKMPATTRLQFDLLTSGRRTDLATQIWRDRELREEAIETFILVRNGASPAALAQRIGRRLGLGRTNTGEALFTYFLQPLSRIRLYSGVDYGLVAEPAASRTDTHRFEPLVPVFGVGIFASLVLFAACANFTILSMARFTDRTPEVGMRKVIGAGRQHLLRQFLGESLLMSSAATLLAILLMSEVLPTLEQFTRRTFELTPAIVASVVTATVLAGLIAAIYPAITLSRIRPIAALSGATPNLAGRRLRHGLIIAQFTLALVSTVCAVTVYRQLEFVSTVDIGLQRDTVFGVRVLTDEQPGRRLRATKQVFLAQPGIRLATASRGLHAMAMPVTARISEGDTDVAMAWVNADEDYLSTFGLDLVQGQNLDIGHGRFTCLLNETAARTLGWAQPIGRRLYPFGLGGPEALVVGVVGDFHVGSIYEKIPPVVIACAPGWVDVLWLTLDEPDPAAVPLPIQQALDELATADLFTGPVAGPPIRLSAVRRDRYVDEVYLLQLLIGLATIAATIACMGLFGLTYYTIQVRHREIGIRRAIGANTLRIIWLLCRENLTLVVVANALAWPLAAAAMLKWLSRFAYHVGLGWEGVAGCALLSIVAMGIAIAHQVYHTASITTSSVIRNL